MVVSIGHLGPPGTYAEAAAITCANWLARETGQESILYPCPTIAQALQIAALEQADLAVVPVENSVEGTVTITLDTLWQLDQLQIQKGLILPIAHALLSQARNLETIQTVYSHPQALAQCQRWLARSLPQAQLVPTNSTTEALQCLAQETTAGAIASQRAAQLYNLSVLAFPVNDHPGNCTQFWVLSLQPSPGGDHTSIAFSLPDNVPGALVKPLQVFAKHGINLSRIQSRPAKQEMGDYLFFLDLEANASNTTVHLALEEVATHTEVLKIFGSYPVIREKDLPQAYE